MLVAYFGGTQGMARLTIVFGVLLMAVAVGAYFIAGAGHSAGTLHPAGLGVLLVLCGALGWTNDLKRRALWMHIAVLVGLIGVGFGLKGAFQVFQLSHGVDLPNPIGVEERALVCLISLIFVAFCIRNFIENRRTRLANQ